MYTPEEQNFNILKTKEFLQNAVSKDNIDDLKKILIFHERKYYLEDNPVISDFEYDQLYKKLVDLETQYPEFITPDSPTQRVSNDISGDFPKVEHLVPMLSLENSYNKSDLLDFDKSVKKLCGIDLDANVTYSVEPKFDGGSIALVYQNNIMTRGATRGNGAFGEDITLNLKTLPSIPLQALFSDYGIYKAEIRGEALIKKSVFTKKNKEREEQQLPLWANPRNAATGGLRTKDASETRKRGLEAFMYNLAVAQDEKGNDLIPSIKNHHKGLNMLSNLGFKVPGVETKLCSNIEEVYQFILNWEEKRDDYQYEIDGMVIKVDDFILQDKCGFTSHHPKWAIAFKFKAKQATSKLKKVEYQVGKIGSITPVAKIEPVYLAGVTVSSISLHNEDFILSKDLMIGDTILVERAGDVIPYIVKSFPELRTGEEQPIIYPNICPVNQTSTKVNLIKEIGEAAWRCPSCVCGAQDLQKIIFHVSKEAMDIDGFGKSYVERFYELGFIKDISDVYNLDFNQIKILEGFGVKSVEKLANAIEKAKQSPIQRLLHSLAIHHLGKRASKIIAEQISNVFDLQNWTVEDFISLKDIGPVVAQNVFDWFSNSNNIELLKRMESYGVNMVQSEEDKPHEGIVDGPLNGKTILFTGTLTQLGRKEAEDLATKNGARNISAVSSNLNILVVGEKAGSKLKKAQDLKTVQIMTEEEFLSLINSK